MQQHKRRLSIWLAAAIVLAGALLNGTPCLAQQGLPPGAIYRPLPPTVYFLGPGTVYSAGVHAEADFLRAVGSLRVDSAIAWSIAEDAYHKHLDNAQLYVKTFFERKLLNAQYSRLLHPSQEERWEGIEKRNKERVESLYYEILKRGNITEELNWLLIHVFEQRMSDNSEFMEMVAEGLEDGKKPPELDKDRLAQIWLTDRPTGTGLKFRAHEGVPLKEDWPYLLEDPKFGDVCTEFEHRRDAAVEQTARVGKVDYEHRRALNEALDGLLLRFDEECRQRLHGPDSPSPGDYAQASGFLRGLRFQVQRFVKTNGQKRPYQFTGSRVSQLVDHMGTAGLYFAPPSPGDEGAYQYVFFWLRNRYLEAASTDGFKKEPEGAAEE